MLAKRAFFLSFSLPAKGRRHDRSNASSQKGAFVATTQGPTGPSNAASLFRENPLVLRGAGLTLNDVVYVARDRLPVVLTDDPAVRRRVQAAFDYIQRACRDGERIYGVTTGFGGMANVPISSAEAADLQANLIWFLKAGAGRPLPAADVRAAMLLRANSFLRGASGLRWELIERMVTFLNAGVTPRVRELGSICASGDLVPLASITGALVGADASFVVDYQGEQVDALTALARLGLSPLALMPKEGLALVNGTSLSTGIAANCLYDGRMMLALTLGAHALIIQGLRGTAEAFHPYIHALKGHAGQSQAAAIMLGLLQGSQLLLEGHEDQALDAPEHLIQDRYSVRCLPQFFGPIFEGLAQITRQVESEMNSANDNPLIDPDARAVFHGGNFLGQYVGVAMDQLRYYLALLAKHLDAQISLLVEPLFSNGLPPSLVGNPGRKVNMGLKGLQLAGNAIMPVIGFLGAPMADRFPTHAEQFNQNINSQAFASANFARQSIETFRQYIAIGLMFGVQAVDLRTYLVRSHYDARATLSPATAHLYETVREVVGRPPSAARPYVWDDNEQSLDAHIERIADDVLAGGKVRHAVRAIWEALGRPALDRPS
jgi:phenylalanine ammonia-lyase